MNIRRYLYILTTAAVMLTAASSCEKGEDDDIILGGGGNTPVSPIPDPGPNPISGDRYKGRIEVPALKSGNLFIQHSTKEDNDSVMAYCLEYDVTANHSRWVAFRFDSKTRGSGAGRSEDFRDDPNLPSQYWIGSGGFGSGYDRGHICASADRQYSTRANSETFCMTNMSPQMSRFNQDYWVGFEEKVQSWGRDKSFADTLYVVKGGTIGGGQTLGTLSRNGRNVVIPKYYFMAVLQCKNNAYKAIGFWMEHKDYGIKDPSNTELATKIVSIDELEENTGIDFFHNLPDAVEDAVEATVVKSAWGFK